MKNIEKTMQLMANGLPLSKALAEVYKTRKVQIVIDNKHLNAPMKQLGLGNRATNCFEKLELNTLGDIVNHISQNGWNSIKNFGKGSAIEVFEKILDFAWSKLGDVERAEFLLQVDKENEARG